MFAQKLKMRDFHENEKQKKQRDQNEKGCRRVLTVMEMGKERILDEK